MHRNFQESGGSEEFQNPKEKPKNPNEKLRGLMKNVAQALNKEAYDVHSLNGLVDSEGQIKPQGYLKIHGQELLDESAAEVRLRELEFSGVGDLIAEKNYASEGVEGEDQILAHWREQKKNQKNTQTELAVTVLLYKILKDRYFVVRTSEYDDVVNGLDTLVIDKTTGIIVCGFDEVHDGSRGVLTEEKKDKILRKARKGGAKIRFGLKIENQKLARTYLENLPVFYLGLTTDELNELIANMDPEDINEPSDHEKIVYSSLIDSVKEQVVLLGAETLPSGVKANLQSFKEILNTLSNHEA